MKFPVSRFTIHGKSMLPTLHPGQDILSFNWAYLGRKPKVGDIVVIKINGKEMVKRVQSVHDREVFVEGDNKEESTDSRQFGAISLDKILGKVIYKTVTLSEAKGITPKLYSSPSAQNDNRIPCPNCGSKVVGIYGRKDAVCKNCGFKLTCCGEP